MTITEFLEARIAEDEAGARRATPGPWRHNPGKVWYQDKDKLARARSGNPFVTGGEEFVGAGPDDGNNETTVGVATTGPEDDPQAMSDARHIARHDPARVLAECAAKRAVISACREDYEDAAASRSDVVETASVVLYALAAVYEDHPDYQQDWAL